MKTDRFTRIVAAAAIDAPASLDLHDRLVSAVKKKDSERRMPPCSNTSEYDS